MPGQVLRLQGGVYCVAQFHCPPSFIARYVRFGQFRAADSIAPMLNAWAIVNNLRPFLPDAQKADQSLAEFFGAQLHDIPWM